MVLNSGCSDDGSIADSTAFSDDRGEGGNDGSGYVVVVVCAGGDVDGDGGDSESRDEDGDNEPYVYWAAAVV